MGNSRVLEKKIDTDLLRRMKNGTVKNPKPLKRVSDPRTDYRSNETAEERKADLVTRRERQRKLPKVIHEVPSTKRSRLSAKYEPNGERECARRVRQAKRKVAP